MGIDHVCKRRATNRHRFLLRLLFAGAALAGVQVVHATTWKDGGGWKTAPVSQGNDGVWSVLPDMSSPNNAHSTTCTPSSCTRTGDVPAPIGRGNPRLSPSASFPKASIARGALALGGRALPWLGAGMALADWYKNAGLSVDPQTGELGEMNGAQALAPSVVYRPDSSPYVNEAGFFASRSEALAAGSLRYVQHLPSVLGSGYTCTLVSPSTWSGSSIVNGSARCQRSGGTSDTYSINVGLVSRTDSVGQCYYVADGRLSGLAATGGVCPSGSFAPVSTATAQAKLETANITADVLKRALADVFSAGGQVDDTGSHSVTGPSSVPGETRTKTTTSSNGTTQVTTSTETHNYTYNDNRVTINTTVTTENPDGSTETETTDNPAIEECEKNPNSAACTELGDPTTAELPSDTKTVTFTPVSFSANQSCPGPVQFNALGRQLEFSYAPMCETISTWVRALVLASCAFIAAFVFIGGLKA